MTAMEISACVMKRCRDQGSPAGLGAMSGSDSRPPLALRPDSFDRAAMTANSIARQRMKTTQPSNIWMKPSACSGPKRCTSRPVTATRKLFITMVIGMVDRNTTARCHNGAL